MCFPCKSRIILICGVFLFLFSIQRLKEQERKHHSTVKRTKEDPMKQKQFGTLDIVITKRKIQVHTSPAKKRKGCESKSIGKSIRVHEILQILQCSSWLPTCGGKGLDPLQYHL